MAYKTNYLEKRFNGITYETVEKAINAGALAYALSDFDDNKKALSLNDEKFNEKELLQDLYDEKRIRIINSTKRGKYMQSLIDSIEFDNTPIVFD